MTIYRRTLRGGNALCAVLVLVAITAAGVGCGSSNSNKGTSPTNSSPTGPGPAETQTTFAYVNNPKSDNVAGLAGNNQNITVSPIPGSPFAAASYPVDVATSGNFVFVLSTGENALNSAEFVLTSFKADASTGALTSASTLSLASVFSDGGYPSNITVDPSGKFLYMSVVGGRDPGDPRIDVFSIDSNSGALAEVTSSPFVLSEQFTGYRMVISPDGKFLFAAASVGSAPAGIAPPMGVQPITRDPNSGTLSTTLVPLARSANSIGASSIDGLAVNPSGNFLVGAAVSMNQVFVWSIDPNTGALTQASTFGDPQATTMVAPRGIAIDPTGKFVIVADSQSSGVSVLTLSNTGTLTPAAGSPFPAGSGPTSVAVSASGKLVFVGNVGSNDMSVFQLDPNSGALSAVQGSPFPIGTSAFNLMTVATVH